jgi:hypothetical protein
MDRKPTVVSAPTSRGCSFGTGPRLGIVTWHDEAIVASTSDIAPALASGQHAVARGAKA